MLVDADWVGHTHALRLVGADPRPGIRAAAGLLAASPDHLDDLVARRSARRPPHARRGRATRCGPTARRADRAGRRSAGLGRRRRPDASRRAARASATPSTRRRCGWRGAVKAHDGFFTTFFVSPYSRYLARWFARRGWRPNHVTVLSMLVALVAAALCATGQRWGYVAGAVLLQASFTLDCVDGQLARYTLDFSRVGAWLDATFDRAKEYALFAGLAIGSARTGVDVWLLAGAAMSLQTVRHSLDFAFAASANPTRPRSSLGGRGCPRAWTRWAGRCGRDAWSSCRSGSAGR